MCLHGAVGEGESRVYLVRPRRRDVGFLTITAHDVVCFLETMMIVIIDIVIFMIIIVVVMHAAFFSASKVVRSSQRCRSEVVVW